MNDDYKLANTSDNDEKTTKKGQKSKDTEDLKKEVDLVSTPLLCSHSVIICQVTLKHTNTTSANAIKSL